TRTPSIAEGVHRYPEPAAAVTPCSRCYGSTHARPDGESTSAGRSSADARARAQNPASVSTGYARCADERRSCVRYVVPCPARRHSIAHLAALLSASLWRDCSCARHQGRCLRCQSLSFLTPGRLLQRGHSLNGLA